MNGFVRRPRNRLLPLLAIGVLLVLDQEAPSAPATAGVPEEGKAIFEERCAVCHGKQGRGDGPEAPFLSPRPASLISAGTSVKTDAEILAVIANGKPRTSMPAWKDLLTEEQRRDVLAYIRTLIRFQPKPLTPPPPAGP